jgi:hypothetical protein
VVLVATALPHEGQAAVFAMRLPAQLEHLPRPLQEKATRTLSTLPETIPKPVGATPCFCRFAEVNVGDEHGQLPSVRPLRELAPEGRRVDDVLEVDARRARWLRLDSRMSTARAPVAGAPLSSRAQSGSGCRASCVIVDDPRPTSALIRGVFDGKIMCSGQ